jgi:hypothetical protein
MKKHVLTIALFAAVALNTAAFAATQQFLITLEPVAGGTTGGTGGGSGTLLFDDTLNTLTFNNITYSGLSAPSSNAHIHGPLPATGVIYGLVPTHTTLGDTFGTISGTLQLVDGTAGISLVDQINQLYNGQWYINIHSTALPGGEISGVILIPEPSTWALLGLGATLLGWRMRRRAN